ncbi:unnamed protein product [Cunninghamella echinulata]
MGNQSSNINKTDSKTIYNELCSAKEYGKYSRKDGREDVSTSILKLSSYISKHNISQSQYSDLYRLLSDQELQNDIKNIPSSFSGFNSLLKKNTEYIKVY